MPIACRKRDTGNIQRNVSGAKPTISPSHEVNLEGPVSSYRPASVPRWDWAFPATAPACRASEPTSTVARIRAACHVTNSFGLQEVRVISIHVKDPNQASIVKPVKAVKARDPELYIIMSLHLHRP